MRISGSVSFHPPPQALRRSSLALVVPAWVTVGTVSNAEVSTAAIIIKAFIVILPFRVAGEETP